MILLKQYFSTVLSIIFMKDYKYIYIYAYAYRYMCVVLAVTSPWSAMTSCIWTKTISV